MECAALRARSSASAGTSGRTWHALGARSPGARHLQSEHLRPSVRVRAAHAPERVHAEASPADAWRQPSVDSSSLSRCREARQQQLWHASHLQAWDGVPAQPSPSRDARGHRAPPAVQAPPRGGRHGGEGQHRGHSGGPRRDSRRLGGAQQEEQVVSFARKRLIELLDDRSLPDLPGLIQTELDTLIAELTAKENRARREPIEARAPATQRPPCPSAGAALAQRVTHAAVSTRLKGALGNMASRIVRALLKADAGQAALDFAAHFHGTRAVLSLHGALMREFAQHAPLATVFELVRVREHLGVPMDLASMTSMLACAAREQRSDVIASTIAAARAAGMPLDTPAFNTALHCHAAAGDAAAFEDTWRTMHTDGCEPNASTHAARVELLLATAEGAAARAYVQRLADLRHAAALSPSLFTTVFSGLARGGGTTYADLRALWDGMVACGVPVNSHNMSAFFKACKSLTLTAAQLAHAYDLVDGFSAAAGAPLSTYQVSTLLAVCKRSGAPGRVTDVWALCQRERVAVTPPLIVMLLACCKAAARECAAARDLAAHLGDWLRVYWLQRREARGEQPKALARTHSSMLIAFNALLAYHADVGAFEEAMAVMQYMHESGPKPDVITYNTLLHCCAGCGQAQIAEELLADMRAFGLAPDVKSFCTVLAACANACEVGRAQRVLRAMEAAGIPLNVRACTSVMSACVWEGSAHSVELAMDMFRRMKAQGIALNAHAYGIVLRGCELAYDVDAAFALYHEACAAGIVPSDALHNSLVRVCAAGGRLDDALALIKELMRAHGTMEQATLNSLTRALCDVYIDRALRMLSFMRTRDMTPGFLTWHALVRGAALASRADVALSLYVEMRTLGHPARSSSGSHLVAALARANRLPAALLVLRDMRACVRGEDGAVAELAAEAEALAGGGEDGGGARPVDAAAPPVLTAEAHWAPPAGSGSCNNAGAALDDPAVAAAWYQESSAAAGAWDDASVAGGGSAPQGPSDAALADGVRGGAQAAQRDSAAAQLQARVLELAQSLEPLPLSESAPAADTVALGTKDRGEDDTAAASVAHGGAASPRSAAVGLVVTALTATGHLAAATLLYGQLCARGPESMVQHVLARTVMFEKLMELNCRQGNVHAALDVFDEWKRARDVLRRRRRAAPQGAAAAEAWGDRPCLSNVTLAFLEACCHAYKGSDDDLQWRVFDVCAFMRQQAENERIWGLPQPTKGSHHVGPQVGEEGDSEYDE